MNESTWRGLCEDIMKEKDPQRLLLLVNQLNQVLERREADLRGAQRTPGVEKLNGE